MVQAGVGPFYADGVTVTGLNLTIVAGQVTTSGGGIENNVGTINLKNSIVALNTLEDDTTIANLSGGFTDQGTNFTTGDPLLTGLLNFGGPTEVLFPKLGSPVRDAGTNAGAPATDQRGVTRPINTTVDIGAVEVDTLAPTINNGDLLVVDSSFDALFRIDPSTGDRTLVSMFEILGTGPAMRHSQRCRCITCGRDLRHRQQCGCRF